MLLRLLIRNPKFQLNRQLFNQDYQVACKSSPIHSLTVLCGQCCSVFQPFSILAVQSFSPFSLRKVKLLRHICLEELIICFAPVVKVWNNCSIYIIFLLKGCSFSLQTPAMSRSQKAEVALWFCV